jgi:dihydrofolate reductase
MSTQTPKCLVSFIVAVADNSVIGSAGNIPWKSRTDMQHFRDMTMGKPVVMGRKTWESLKKPLDGRENIVISRDLAYKAEGATVTYSVEEAIEQAAVLAQDSNNCEIMVIGGSTIYAELLDRADRIYLTEIHLSPQGDTFFWGVGDLKKRGWSQVATEKRAAGPRDDADLTFSVLIREKTNI